MAARYAPIDLPTVENLVETLLPRVVTAAMQTTTMRATSSAYSTSDAPVRFSCGRSSTR